MAATQVLQPPILFIQNGRQAYQVALSELDPNTLPGRAEAAEIAIFKRLQAISQSPDNKAERQAIEDALASPISLGFPDWREELITPQRAREVRAFSTSTERNARILRLELKSLRSELLLRECLAVLREHPRHNTVRHTR
jgi:hypothetical protein